MTVSRAPGHRPRPQVPGTATEAPPTEATEPRRGDELPAGAGPPVPLGAGDLSQRRARWRAAVGTVPALALTAALGCAGTAGFGLAWVFDSGSSPPTAGVLSSSRQVVTALTNFDPGTVSSDFAGLEREATGGFASQARRFFGTRIQRELRAADAASRGQIEDLYVQSVAGTRATVFAVVSQKYLNKDAPSPVDDTLRLVLDLREIGGAWKVSSVQVLQQPVSAGVGSK
ncbi:MAG TPA: hypothetical protein VKU92_13620 [Acidimicrobiales bacterium]|nr:hypothetical protein [Acidimicrobiales bacterium]